MRVYSAACPPQCAAGNSLNSRQVLVGKPCEAGARTVTVTVTIAGWGGVEL